MIFSLVMRELDPRIHDEAPHARNLPMNCRVKQGSDEVFFVREVAR